MTENEITAGRREIKFQLTSLVVPIIFSTALLTILFVLPQPTITVNLPFKAEMFLTVALIVMLAVAMRSKIESEFARDRDSGLLRSIVVSICLFITWSGASVIWGPYFDGVAHHTLLWSVYLVYFLVFTVMLRTDPSNRTIVSTLAIISIFMGILCIFDYLTVADFINNEGYLRIRYGKYGEMLITISPMLWVLAIYTRKRWLKVVFAAGAILSWMTAMLSLSKGVFLGGLVGFTVLFAGAVLFSPRGFRKRVVLATVVWVVFTVGFQVFFSLASDVPSTTDYISGKNDATRMTSEFRVFSWGVGRQMATDHWLTGAGADTFNVRFNDSRTNYRLTSPEYPLDEPGEDYIVERAHNELIQIAAELGSVGVLLVAVPFGLFALFFVRSLYRNRYELSPVFWASIAGMAAFGFNSMVSSFSFRSAQNGVVFFMIFAIGVNELSKKSKRKGSTRGFAVTKPIYAACWVFTLLLGVYCVSKVVAEYNVYRAEQTGDSAESHSHYQVAVKADPEYAGLYLSMAARNMADNEPDKAAQNTRKAIDNGVGMALTYSTLAKQQVAAGLISDAEATFQEALRVYPRSTFIRTEYIVFLEKQGRGDEAVRQAEIARVTDLKAANGWYKLITTGSTATFHLSQTDESVTPPAKLVPSAAVQQYVDPIPFPEQ